MKNADAGQLWLNLCIFCFLVYASKRITCKFMTTIIDRPKNIDEKILAQLIDLIENGEQVQRKFIKRGIETAELIAFFIDKDELIASATLKNPLHSYRDKVFRLADAEDQKKDFAQELGYIVTNPKYEGQKLCQKLLTEFFKIIDSKEMFATTRKSSMAHILKKFGYRKLGPTYKKDLELFIYNGKK